jgi:hypothetical protein
MAISWEIQLFLLSLACLYDSLDQSNLANPDCYLLNLN